MLAVSDHDMVVQFEFKGIGRCLQLAGRLNVFPRRLGIAGRMIVEQSTQVQISLNLQRLMRFAKSAGIAVWCMFFVLTRDFPRLTTTMLCRFHSNTFEHGFRITTLLNLVAPSVAIRPAHPPGV